MEIPDKMNTSDINPDDQINDGNFDHGRTYFVERIAIPRDELDENKVNILFFNKKQDWIVEIRV